MHSGVIIVYYINLDYIKEYLNSLNFNQMDNIYLLSVNNPINKKCIKFPAT